MAPSQSALREKVAQLSTDAKVIRKELHRAMVSDEITLSMLRAAEANINHAIYALDAGRTALSEFMPLDARELAEATDAAGSN